MHTSETAAARPVWLDSDFPKAPPDDCGLSWVQWRDFRACMLKAGVPKQAISDEKLRAGGFSSWKDYIVSVWPLNWG